MEGRCDVCGCATEKEELKKFSLGEDTYDICVFCRKQLNSIAAAPSEKQDTALNMLIMDTKGRRSAKCQKALGQYFQTLGIDFSSENENEKQQAKETVKAYMPKTAVKNSTTEKKSLEQEVFELKQQVDDLNKRMDKFRSRYIKSKILGIVIPIVFVLVMLIVLLASGALQNIFDYYDTLNGYANM